MRRIVTVLACLALLALPALADGPAGGERYLIPFSSGTVDPARDFPAADPADFDLVLVQWRALGDSGVVHRLAATGARLVQPLAPVNYLVWADAGQTRTIRGLDGVRFAGVLPAHARVSTSVTTATTRLRVTVVAGETLPDLPGLSLRPRAFTDLDGAVAAVAGGIAEAEALAGLPTVYSVAAAPGAPVLRDERSAQVVAHGSETPPEPGYGEFLDEIGADGSGVRVSVVDTGVDGNHADLDGQVVECYEYRGMPDGCALGNNDSGGHGTHVAGIVAGTAASPFGDLDGFAYGQGVAPGAELISQNVLAASNAAFADGFRPVYRAAYDDGAIVSQNSWGPAGSPQGYDEDTREMDTIPRDVVDDSGVDDPQAFVLSIMNGGGGTSTQGSPDEAKNLIKVGATVSRDLLGGRDDDDLCTCTAHGPALDGRMLPDLVAPGQSVVSTRALNGTTGITAGSAGDWPPSPFHGPATGTSMASPHVSGGYAVFVDWLRRNVDADLTPSPALVKAAFVNQAEDLSVAGGADANGRALRPIPNNQQGWGRFNLGNVIDAWDTGVVHVDQEVAFTASGDSHTLTVEALDPGAPLKATLVWTDAPGHGQGEDLPAWVNDLDLVVTAPDGITYLGNVFTDGWSAPGGEPDPMNNVENVYLPGAGDGAYTVTVDAANIIGQASPNADSVTWQDFALVVSNARLVEG